MRLRRVWLGVASVASLVVLVYAGVFTAFSVPVTADMERASRLPDADSPAVGQRALVIPIADPTLVPTLEDNDGSPAEARLVLVGEPGSSFPVNAKNASLARAVAYVAPTANGSYVPPQLTVSLPRVENGSVVHENVTLDIATLAGTRAGFLVTHDAGSEVFFVETARVLGVVSRFEPGVTVVSLFVLASLGFFLPLLALVFTHRASGKPGLGPTPAGGCPECRAPAPPGASFCTKCGAWLDGRQVL